MKTNAKKLTTIGMLCAISYVVMLVGRFPVVLFLKYDPKDVIITIGGFIFGPMTSLIISVIVSFVEMFTASETGIIGCIMNILSTCSFACTASYIYKKKHTLKGAITGLLAGIVVATTIILLWNYLITPIYMGYPREAVAELLVPVFLPFNLLKCSLNAVITILIYKPVVTALRKSGLLATSTSSSQAPKNKRNGIMIISALLLVTLIFLMLVLAGKI